MNAFSEFISSYGLLDIPMEGGMFTWSNNREAEAMSHIDRILYSPGWEEAFPTITQRRQSRILSDHFPILLECGQFSRGRRPFRFENMWLKAEGFMEQVKKWWEAYQFYGTPSYILAHKLKALKLDLKRWNEEVFGNVSFKRKLLFEKLTEMDVLAETRPLSAAEKSQRENLVADLEKQSLMEKICWWQKS
jgi:hypothetical protein